MIQSIVFFSLGFLCAGFLALMVAPVVWRRAVMLTRKRIEATVPLTLNEIQADKDRIRAEFAMSTRRLEMSIKSFKEKAASQIVEINRNREELKRLAEERAERDQAISELELRGSELREELRQREDRLQVLSDRLGEAERKIEERSLELERLGRMYEEASFTSSNRQIELVARETEVERLSGDVSVLRTQRKDAEKRLREISSENKQFSDALKLERRRYGDLEKKIERMMATLSDREEKLDRREKELARLREQWKSSSKVENDLNVRLTEAQKDRVRLEAELADMTLQMSTLLSGAKGGDVEKAIAKLSVEGRRLEGRLTELTRENRRLRGELSAHQRARTEDWDDERRESAVLREQINDLAAEMVNMAAVLEGPDSPIRTALSAPAGAAAGGPVPGAPASLADRVRALQKAAAAAT